MKVMGIDYGDARTGIAISDLLHTIVGSTTVIHSRNKEKTIILSSQIETKTMQHLVSNYSVTLNINQSPKNHD